MNKNSSKVNVKEWVQSIDSEVPEVVRTRLDQTLKALPVKRTFIRTFIQIACACLLLLGCVIGTSLLSPAMAQTIQKLPYIETLLSKVGDKGLQVARHLGLSTPILQQVTDQNITIEIEDIVYDGYRLAISYQLKGEGNSTPEPVDWLNQKKHFSNGENIGIFAFHDPFEVTVIEEEEFLGVQEMVFFINGEKLINYLAQNEIEQTGENTFSGLTILEATEEFPDEFNLSMTIKEIGKTQGTWDFTYPVSRKASDLETVTFYPNVEEKIADITLSVKEVTLYPSATMVRYTVKQPKDSSFADQLLKNEIMLSFLGEKHKHTEFTRYRVPLLSEEGADEIYEYVAYLDSFVIKPEHLILKPLVFDGGKIEFSHVEFNDQPFTLDQGEIGEIQVTKIDHAQEKTTLTIKAEGYDPLKQVTHFWFEDEYGFKISRQGQPKLINESNSTYTIDFPPLNNKSNLAAGTRQFKILDLFKEVEIRIPLDGKK